MGYELTGELLDNLKQTGDQKAAVEVAHEQEILVSVEGKLGRRGDSWVHGLSGFAVEDLCCFNLLELEPDTRIGLGDTTHPH